MSPPATFNLLVVDDEEMNRDVLTRRLEKVGYHVVTVDSGPKALEVVRTKPIDLVLLDVMMPGMDGLEVLTQIRETHSLVELPVMMTTARDQSGDVVAALQLGANDYVTKPINFPLLLARIQTQLAIRKARVEPAKVATPEPGGSKSGSRSDAALLGTPQAGPTLSDSSADRKKSILMGEYEVLEELGRGGMGAVYKARHLRMNRLVALKVINREYLVQPESVKRFYKEVQAAAQLAHPNIVIAYDSGQVDDTHYMAMEYVEGVTLSKLVRQQGPLRVGLACEFVRQVALGLQHAHEKGLVHRDIKPSNLLVASPTAGGDTPKPAAPTIKILDFGLALIQRSTEQMTDMISDLTKEDRIVGSVDYMAPEQWKSPHNVDIRADLYGLGCTFYFLLTGQVPFPGDEPLEKMFKHNLDEPTPVEQIRPEIPPKVAAIVRRLMAKRIDQRYQTPGELAELLKWIVQAGRDL
jgi:DNA-binding response OmpR family regulator/tRNA A-37 threonylcarbamoyl transferase component Bud32